jgi:hypothetical protein
MKKVIRANVRRANPFFLKDATPRIGSSTRATITNCRCKRASLAICCTRSSRLNAAHHTNTSNKKKRMTKIRQAGLKVPRTCVNRPISITPTRIGQLCTSIRITVVLEQQSVNHVLPHLPIWRTDRHSAQRVILNRLHCFLEGARGVGRSGRDRLPI